MRNAGRNSSPEACHKPAEAANMAEVNNRLTDVPFHSTEEDQSQSMSFPSPTQQINIRPSRSQRNNGLPIRSVHVEFRGADLVSYPSLVIRVRNDGISMASGRANNPSVALRAKQKQTIAAEMKRTIDVAVKKSEPTDAEIEAELDEAQGLFETLKRKAPTQETSPPAKKVRLDKMTAWLSAEGPRRHVIAHRIGIHQGLLAADACSDGMFSHPEPLKKGSLPAWILEDDRSDTDSNTSLDLRNYD